MQLIHRTVPRAIGADSSDQEDRDVFAHRVSPVVSGPQGIGEGVTANQAHQEGFFAGWHGGKSGPGEAAWKSRGAHEHAVKRDMLIVEATERRAQADAKEKQLQRAKAEYGAKLAALPEPGPAERQADTAAVSAFHVAFFFGAVAIAIAGEVALIRVSVGPVFGLPTRGPDAWEGWSFAVGLALMLVVPLKIAFHELVSRPLRSGDPRSLARFSRVMVLTSLMTGVAIGLYAYIRWIYLLTTARNELLANDVLVTPLFDQYPVSTATALVVIAFVLAVSGAICLSYGTDHLEKLWRILSASGRRLRAALINGYRVRKAATELRHAQRAADAAPQSVAESQSKLDSLADQYEKLVTCVLGRFREGFESGQRAREAAASDQERNTNGQVAWEAYWRHQGYTISKGRGKSAKTEVASTGESSGGVDGPGNTRPAGANGARNLPFHRLARDELDIWVLSRASRQ